MTTFDDFLTSGSATYALELLPVDDKFRLARVNRRTMELFSAECRDIAAKCTSMKLAAYLGSVTMCRLARIKNDYSLHYWEEIRIASEFGHCDLVTYLIGLSGSLMHDEALIGACRGGHQNLVKEMVEIGADDFEMALCAACRGGHSSLAELMIELGADNFDEGLHSACLGGHRDLAEKMIKLGATDLSGALRETCSYGHRKNIGICSRLGFKYPGQRAGNRIETAKMLLGRGVRNIGECMIAACLSGDRGLAEMLIERGASDYESGLQTACEYGHYEVAEMLVKRGVKNLDACLLTACRHGHRNIVELLLDYGATDLKGGIREAYDHYYNGIGEMLIRRRARDFYNAYCDADTSNGTEFMVGRCVNAYLASS